MDYKVVAVMIENDHDLAFRKAGNGNGLENWLVGSNLASKNIIMASRPTV